MTVTDWFSTDDTRPIYIGWYDVLHDDGTVGRYWHGRLWWSNGPPSETNIEIFGPPGSHWRGCTTGEAKHGKAASPAEHEAALDLLCTGECLPDWPPERLFGN